MTGPVFLIAEREFRTYVATVSFWLALGLAPALALFAFLLTCVILLSQSLYLLNVVINGGQSAGTFLYMAMLLLPGLLRIILPIAFFVGTLFALSRLNSDSELVVMSAAGMTAPAWSTLAEAGAATRSGETVRLSGVWLRKASWRSCAEGVDGCGASPRLARSGCGTGVADVAAGGFDGRVSVDENNRAVRADSIS